MESYGECPTFYLLKGTISFKVCALCLIHLGFLSITDLRVPPDGVSQVQGYVGVLYIGTPLFWSFSNILQIHPIGTQHRLIAILVLFPWSPKGGGILRPHPAPPLLWVLTVPILRLWHRHAAQNLRPNSMLAFRLRPPTSAGTLKCCPDLSSEGCTLLRKQHGLRGLQNC